MGALPKRKISKGRKNRRRAHHALVEPTVSTCPKCGKARRPHFQCEFCGYYGDKPESKKKATKAKSKPAAKKTTKKETKSK